MKEFVIMDQSNFGLVGTTIRRNEFIIMADSVDISTNHYCFKIGEKVMALIPNNFIVVVKENYSGKLN